MKIWKDIIGYERLYQVSDCGQVKSCERVVKGPRGDQRLKERILKPGLHSTGYFIVNLCKDGRRKNYSVHRLVALAFLEGDNSLTVNHIDECKTNNHVSNLEYLTQGDNVRSWNKNNSERRADILKKAIEASLKVRSRQVLDTKTGRTFPSISAASHYMHEKEAAKGPLTWLDKISRGTQDRFIIQCHPR